jgi:lambda repressor-like predicted transcriptional regulator
VDVVAWRRKRRVLARVTRAAWRLEQAERERAWALAAAKAEGASIREIATAAGLSSSRVHQVVTDADIDALDTALGVLRSAGWPAPEDPEVDDGDLVGRADIAGRLDDEVEWIRQCADWLEHLDRERYPTVVNLRPESDWPRRFQVAADLPRIVAILRRIAYDVHELARSRRVDDLDQAAVAEDPRAERRRRAAEPALEFIAFCRRREIPHQSTPQLERAYDAWNAERYERGETDQGSWEAYNPVREARNRSGNWTL